MTKQKVKLGTLGNGETATIYCRSVGTRSGFRHDAVMLIPGEPRITAKACYLNRTWESYQFQSVLHELAEKFIKARTGCKDIFSVKAKRFGRLYRNLVNRIDKNHGGEYIVDERIFG